MRKRKPKYLKILEGMNACYGGTDARDCSNCPYEKYNDPGIYGEGAADCMLQLNKDAKDWTETMTMFTTCEDCICWHPDRDEHNEWRWTDDDKEQSDGFCSVWNAMMFRNEYCARGGMKDL